MEAMTLPTITPAQAKALLDEGARLIDIRDADEHRRQSIPGADNMPLSTLEPVSGHPAIIWHCRSGMRTGANADRLAAASHCPGYLLEGGIDGWRSAGLPVKTDAKAPLEIMRQVQMIAGLLILSGVVLSLTVAQGFVALSAFVGAGLFMAGATGWCGMAKLLGLMPWNRRAA